MKNNYQLILYLSLGLGLYLLVTAYKMVIGPLIIGALLAYLLYPLVIFLAKKTPLSHSQSAVFVFILFSLLVVAVRNRAYRRRILCIFVWCLAANVFISDRSHL